MKRLTILGLVVLACIPARADPDSEDAVRERAALIDFAISPEAYAEDPIVVRCPAFGADLMGVSCRAYNAQDQAVGSVHFIMRELPTADQRRAIDDCAGPTPDAACVARITASVNEFGVPIAKAIDWPNPRNR